MSSIRLHKEKGLNCFMSFCPRCYREAEELFLVGANDSVYQCNKCKKMHIGRPSGAKCMTKGCRGSLSFERKLEEGERLPASEPCKSCQQEIREHKIEVSKGGIYWKCDKCNYNGVIKAESKFAEHFRKKNNIFAPDPIGVDFTEDAKGRCPVCSKV